MQLCHSAQGNTNVIDLLNGGSGFYNMTIYGLGTASTLFILLFSICLILFSLLAIGLNVPFLIAVMASKIGMLLLFTGGSFAIAFPLDWGNCIEGGGVETGWKRPDQLYPDCWCAWTNSNGAIGLRM